MSLILLGWLIAFLIGLAVPFVALAVWYFIAAKRALGSLPEFKP